MATEFTFNGFRYRTNEDASLVEGRDGKSWNRTGSLRVIEAAQRAVAASKKTRKGRIVHVEAATPSDYRWFVAHCRGARSTPDGFVVTNEGDWRESLRVAGAVELK